MNHLYKIKNKQGQLVTFKPNYPQLKHLSERRGHRYNLVVKARQFGFTTLYCIDLLDEALWVAGTSCAILGHEREAVDMIFEIVKRAYTNLPEVLKPQVKTDTVRMLRFTHRFDGTPLDSSIYVALKLRSGTVQRLHITESAYIKDRQELVAGSKQAVPLTGAISEETTANGFNDFYDFYIDAVNKKEYGDLDYKPYFYPWYTNPEYKLEGELLDKTMQEEELQKIHNLTDKQLLWRRWKMNELKRSQSGLGLTGEQLFKQEYPASVMEAFQSGAGHVFDPEKIESHKPQEPLNMGTELERKGVTIWQSAEISRKYIIGVDPSDGEGADYGCIDVWTEDDNKIIQVAQYYGKLRPDELAELSAEVGRYYNDAFIGVENNMLTTILFLSKIYDNYYFDTRIDEKTQKRTKKIGWSTNVKTRDVMIDDFNILFDEGSLQINSKLTLNEMRTFVRKDNGKREHADGKHDDALFAGFIAVQMRKFNKPRVRVWENKPF